MATGGKLEVGIGADITDLQKKIALAEKEIKEMANQKIEHIKLGVDTRELTIEIKNAKKNLLDLKNTAKDSGNAISGMAPKVANGSNALMQFSRIAQDAPYGIMGIGNNITATLESFDHLKNSTGSAGGALKAMASSIMGSGGILLGVSLLTTGFTLLAQSGLSVGDIIDKVTGKFDEFGGAIKTASEEGVKATAGEVFGLKALVSVAQDETKARKERLAAVEALQSQYPGYFGNLSKEQIMTQSLTGVVNELAQALISKEIAQNLAKAAAPQLLALYKLNAVYKKQRKEYTESQEELRRIGYEQGETTQTYKEAEATMWGYYDAMEKTRGEIYKATEVNKRYEDSINAINGSASKLLIKSPTKEKQQKESFNTPQVSGVSQLIPLGLVVSPIDTTPITTAFKGIKQTVSSDLLATQELLYNFSKDVNDLVVGSLGNTFSNLGTSIGEALASGQNVFQAIGSSLLASLGDFLSDMGSLLIKYGLLAIAKGNIDLAILTGGPVAIGAGIAAVAVGVLLKAAGGAISSKAKAGSKGTSTSTGSGANNTSTTSGNGTGWSGGANGTVVFEIAGTSLIGVLNNTTERNLRIGGR